MGANHETLRLGLVDRGQSCAFKFWHYIELLFANFGEVAVVDVEDFGQADGQVQAVAELQLVAFAALKASVLDTLPIKKPKEVRDQWGDLPLQA